MALTQTSLSAGCGASDTTLAITSTSSGFPAVGVIGSKQVMRVGDEDMLIDVVPVAGSCKVLLRGWNGTLAVPHAVLEPVQTSSNAQDFLDNPVGSDVSRPPYVDDIVAIGENTVFAASGTTPSAGVLPWPTRNTTYTITKGSACAITLIATGATTPAPSQASAGVRMTFINGVAAVNTVTYGPGFHGDTSTSDVATSLSLVGVALQLEISGTGLVSALNANTFASTGGWVLA